MTDIRKVLNNEVNTIMNFILDKGINDFDYKKIKTITFKNKKYLMKMTINFKKF